mmetsp:Transcript_32489/g.107071  ORF Transcript_32489/g.107071 Transcript_32489/m.107071 type:complete len:231 (+) Transcript_32489:122-814(+)
MRVASEALQNQQVACVRSDGPVHIVGGRVGEAWRGSLQKCDGTLCPRTVGRHLGMHQRLGEEEQSSSGAPVRIPSIHQRLCHLTRQSVLPKGLRSAAARVARELVEQHNARQGLKLFRRSCAELQRPRRVLQGISLRAKQWQKRLRCHVHLLAAHIPKSTSLLQVCRFVQARGLGEKLGAEPELQDAGEILPHSLAVEYFVPDACSEGADRVSSSNGKLGPAASGPVERS